jgi:hypothetical protein
MVMFAALLVYCLCFPVATRANNPDKWTGTGTSEKALIQISGSLPEPIWMRFLTPGKRKEWREAIQSLEQLYKPKR